MMEPAAPTPRAHCPNADGAFIGLAADGAYTLRLPSDAAGGNPETWERVTASASASPINGSFTGVYVQALPDDRDTYADIYGVGSFTMTGLDFQLEVKEAGVYTLFLRWTGGDTYGGGDSLYAVMRDTATDAFMPGPSTFKKKLVPMDEAPGVVGCCYDHATHQCPCFTTVQEEGATCMHWVDKERARRFGQQCEVGNGEMEAVQAPRWYLFAGQANGNVMDFDSEPWDATCEAEGTGTRDTGLDFASWQLSAGSYRLVFYPREDGTAFDAFYLAGPRSSPPTELRLSAGDSTLCTEAKEVAAMGGGLLHSRSDAPGWGERSLDWRARVAAALQGRVDGQPAGEPCGTCLVAVAKEDCPPADELAAMQTCDLVAPGELCEADGECGTDIFLNNCNALQAVSSAGGAGGGGPRQHQNRQNDVYRRMLDDECRAAAGGLSAWLVVLLLLVALCALAGASYACVATGAAAAVRGKLSREMRGTRTTAPVVRITTPLAGMSGISSTMPGMAAPAAPLQSGGASEYIRRDDLQFPAVVATGNYPD